MKKILLAITCSLFLIGFSIETSSKENSNSDKVTQVNQNELTKTKWQEKLAGNEKNIHTVQFTDNTVTFDTIVKKLGKSKAEYELDKEIAEAFKEEYRYTLKDNVLTLYWKNNGSQQSKKIDVEKSNGQIKLHTNKKDGKVSSSAKANFNNVTLQPIAN